MTRAIESPPSLGLEESLCEGWLLRKSTNNQDQEGEKWKKRYFNVIQAPQDKDKWLFAYFKDSSMSKVLNAIQLSHVRSVKLVTNNDVDKTCEFEIEMVTGDLHVMRTWNSTEATAWVLVLERARKLSSNTSSGSSNATSISTSTSSSEMKFFEDEMLDMLEVVDLAPDSCPILPATNNGYYDDFSGDVEMGYDNEENEEDEDEEDDEEDGFGDTRESVNCVLNRRRSLVLELTYSNLLPPPTLKARVTGTRNTTDAYSKEYTQYELDVRQGKLQWNIYRRFKEFKALHAAIKGKGIDTSVLPKLPHRQVSPPMFHFILSLSVSYAKVYTCFHLYIFSNVLCVKVSGSLNDETVQLRSDALNKYVTALLSQDAALSNIHVLSFLGLMNLNRFEEQTDKTDVLTHSSDHSRGSSESGSGGGGVGSDEEGDSVSAMLKVSGVNRCEVMSPVLGSKKTRPVMHISTLRAHAAPGDLILFRCANSMSGLQVNSPLSFCLSFFSFTSLLFFSFLFSLSPIYVACLFICLFVFVAYLCIVSKTV